MLLGCAIQVRLTAVPTDSSCLCGLVEICTSGITGGGGKIKPFRHPMAHNKNCQRPFLTQKDEILVLAKPIILPLLTRLFRVAVHARGSREIYQTTHDYEDHQKSFGSVISPRIKSHYNTLTSTCESCLNGLK